MLTPQEKVDLFALKEADYALYKLWRRTQVDTEQMHLINRLQKDFIHPAIETLEKKASA